MIHGAFKFEDLSNFQLYDYRIVLNEIPNITLEKYLTLFEKNSKEQNNLLISINLIDEILNYFDVTQKSVGYLDNYISMLNVSNNLLRFFDINKERKKLIEECNIAEKSEGIAEISAKKSLLNKLNDSIKEYKSQLNLIKEDYLKDKNQKNQLEKNLEKLKKNQNELKQTQKTLFNQINTFSRQEDDLLDEDNKNLEELRTKAKKLREEIKDLNPKIEETLNILTQLTPTFQEKDKKYQNLMKNINNDEEKANQIREEIKEIVVIEGKQANTDSNSENLITSRPISVIKSKLEIINREIQKLENQQKKKLTKDEKSILSDLKTIKTKIDDFYSKKLDTFNQNEILKKGEALKQINQWLLKLQNQINQFLFTINLKCSIDFELILKPNQAKKCQLSFKFLRSTNSSVDFNEMTTPEKIFFIICFYITVEILKNKSHIVFSNLLIPKEYDRKGSINRALTKIKPFFLENQAIKEKQLTFIIAGFTLTKDLENIQVYEIIKEKSENKDE